MTAKTLHAIPDLCTGCKQCELVCSLTKTGILNPEQARLRVTQSAENGSCKIVTCRTCRVPLCREACPIPEAMTVDEHTGAVVIDSQYCVVCLACVDACPFGAITVGPNDEVLKCDLCGGDPMCVKYCPPRPANQFPGLPYPKASALEFVEANRRTRKRLGPLR